ncbi:MAG: 30S ribosomal protein S17 [Actinomycetota bacterium]
MTERGIRKTRVGRVTSDKMDKTVVVNVDSTTRHALYAKTIRRQRKFYAHDEENTAKVGDLVRIAEARPTSKLKRWRVVEVVEKARE